MGSLTCESQVLCLPAQFSDFGQHGEMPWGAFGERLSADVPALKCLFISCSECDNHRRAAPLELAKAGGNATGLICPIEDLG